VESEIKHVILLSDGRSLPDDFESLVQEMAAAEETVSTVAGGTGADRELLNDIARWGNDKGESSGGLALLFFRSTSETGKRARFRSRIPDP
jgi:hypothetical protein